MNPNITRAYDLSDAMMINYRMWSLALKAGDVERCRMLTSIWNALHMAFIAAVRA